MNLERFRTLICLEVIIQEFIHHKFQQNNYLSWMKTRVPILENCFSLIKKELKNSCADENRKGDLVEAYRAFCQRAIIHLQEVKMICSKCPEDILTLENEYILIRNLIMNNLQDVVKNFAMFKSTCKNSVLHDALISLFANIAQTVKSIPHHVITAQILDGCLYTMSIPQVNSMKRIHNYNYFFYVFKLAANWDWDKQVGTFLPIERLVIYLNFNSEGIANYFMEKINNELGQINNHTNRLTNLLKYRKLLDQLPVYRKTPYDKHGLSVKKQLLNWINAEIKFLYEAPSVTAATKREFPTSPIPLSNKVLCKLSGDQIAIVLRAADEVKIVESRSLNMVYKTMIPYIATENRTILSPSSVRVKSYHPEHNDKKMVIEKLNQMIEKIKNY